MLDVLVPSVMPTSSVPTCSLQAQRLPGARDALCYQLQIPHQGNPSSLPSCSPGESAGEILLVARAALYAFWVVTQSDDVMYLLSQHMSQADLRGPGVLQG